ncbi:MAG: add [candidate division NC10 bacterium]|jgi:adenosine deaminase|nr:add [candidate division NC10 bacterium]
MTIRERARALPKLELHVHLEGAIPVTALWELVCKYGRPPGMATLVDLERRFTYRDFAHFLEMWGWKNGFLREYEDFAFVTERVAADFAAQNIVYAEAFFSPGDFARHGLQIQRLTEAIRQGLSVHTDRVQVRLVADLVRDFGPENGRRWLREIDEVKHLGIVGIGIGGSEQQFPPEPYEAVYREARERGFKTSAHAGEAAGAESVWGAVRTLEVDRIGHGTRAVEDRALVALLAERRIPLEMCPISNVRTGVVPSLAAHPIRELIQAGVLVTVNTDDPKMFNTSLEDEYEALATELGFTWEELEQFNANAVEAAWCGEDERARLAGRVAAARRF